MSMSLAVFLVNFCKFVGHDARIAPFSFTEISSKIQLKSINIYY